MSTTIGGVRIVDMPDLGTVTDNSSVVGEHAGSGRFGAPALRDYVANYVAPSLHNIGRNLLHNPLMSVGQRGAGPFTAPGYTLDRWLSSFVAGDAMSFTQLFLSDTDRGAIGDEAVFTALGNAFAGGAGASNVILLVQRIEGVQRLAGKTVTLSFWANATASLSISVAFTQVFGTGGSPSAVAPSLGTVVPIATAPARYQVVMQIPSIAGKALGANGDHCTQIEFCFSAGSANAARFGIGVQSGGVWITGVQLEVGSVATPLEKPDPRYDLSDCQRFYQRQVPMFWQGAGTTGIVYALQMCIPTMRAPPSLVIATNSSVNMGTVAVATANTNAIQATGSATATGVVALAVSVNCSADL